VVATAPRECAIRCKPRRCLNDSLSLRPWRVTDVSARLMAFGDPRGPAVLLVADRALHRGRRPRLLHRAGAGLAALAGTRKV
jgi:hypothetical protein